MRRRRQTKLALPTPSPLVNALSFQLSPSFDRLEVATRCQHTLRILPNNAHHRVHGHLSRNDVTHNVRAAASFPHSCLQIGRSWTLQRMVSWIQSNSVRNRPKQKNKMTTSHVGNDHGLTLAESEYSSPLIDRGKQGSVNARVKSKVDVCTSTAFHAPGPCI